MEEGEYAKRARENDNNNDDDSLDEILAVAPSKRPKALQGHNKFNRSSHWDTSKEKE